MTVTAFFGEPKLKATVLERLHEHRRLDQIVQQVYWEGGRGCHLGCLTHDNDNSHEATERMFGIPLRVAYWLEAVFEGLPTDKCAAWVTDSIDAIPVGADLSLAHHHLAVWLLGPEGPSAKGNAHPLVTDAVAQVRDMHHALANGEVIDAAAWSAAWSAAGSAESAARSAAWSAARSAAGSAAWESIAAKSLDIFRAAPVVQCDQCEGQIEETWNKLMETGTGWSRNGHQGVIAPARMARSQGQPVLLEAGVSTSVDGSDARSEADPRCFEHGNQGE